MLRLLGQRALRFRHLLRLTATHCTCFWGSPFHAQIQKHVFVRVSFWYHIFGRSRIAPGPPPMPKLVVNVPRLKHFKIVMFLLTIWDPFLGLIRELLETPKRHFLLPRAPGRLPDPWGASSAPGRSKMLPKDALGTLMHLQKRSPRRLRLLAILSGILREPSGSTPAQMPGKRVTGGHRGACTTNNSAQTPNSQNQRFDV